MITLYRYIPAWDMVDLSPFCIKVESYLRMAGVPFESRVGDVRKAPKGKLPYIEDDGVIISDSRDIIDHVERRIPNALDRDLSPEQLALTTAFRALIEEEVYFYAMVLRWTMDDGWKIYQPILRRYLVAIGVPALFTPIAAAMARRQVTKAAVAQGSGRHSREELEVRMLHAMQAVATQMQAFAGPYFFGQEPHVIDATAYAFLSAALDSPFPSKAKELLSKDANALAYAAGIKERYFS